MTSPKGWHISLGKRSTVRGAAHSLGVPKSSLHDQIGKQNKGKKGKSKSSSSNSSSAVTVVSSYKCPKLSEDNRLKRLIWVCDHITASTNKFVRMTNIVHIDEKWFYCKESHRKIYAHPTENIERRPNLFTTTQLKVMFLAAISRPSYDHHLKKEFSGLIGICPFVEESISISNSKNRPSVTILLELLASVKRECEMICHKRCQ